METTIMAVSIDSRNAHAPEVQEIFTKHGCIIKTRLGLHETSSDKCSTRGLIILQIQSNEKEIENLSADLQNISGVNIKHMTI